MRFVLLLLICLLLPTLTSLGVMAETLPETANGTAQAVPEITPITEALGVEQLTHNITRGYAHYFDKYEIRGTTKGNWILTAMATALALILSLLARTISYGLLNLTLGLFKWLNLPNARIHIYARILRAALLVAIAIVTFYTYNYVWDTPAALNPFEHQWFLGLIDIMVNSFVVLTISALVWETLNTAIHVAFVRSGGVNSSRARTIMPIIRNFIFVAFAIMFILVFLSEFGINIMPLLAGAGIVGIAIGFGAQNMVKDFITGFTLIMEDVMRVGDYVTIAGVSGTVEQITLRKVQLRNYAGVVYTIPFSSISLIHNSSKEFSAFEINLRVNRNANTDHVFSIIERVVESLQNDPTFAPIMLNGLEVSGVTELTDSSVLLKGRIRTVAGKQSTIGNEFNRRIKLALERENIAPAIPQQIIWPNGAPQTDTPTNLAPNQTEPQ